MIEGILIEGFIYGIMVLAVFLSFRVLNFCDMTVDGSFPLGAAVVGALLSQGVSGGAALLAAFAAGLLAGLVTALIHTKVKVPDLLAGILTMTMLYSVNLRIMGGRANISLLRVPTVMSRFSEWAGSFMPPALAVLLFCAVSALAIKAALDLFFHTDLGLCFGGLGANPQMIISQGINPDILKMLGISLSNGLVALAGSLAAMYQGFADVGLGTGMIVSGLASLMIGEFVIRSNRIGLQTLRVLAGSILYRGLMYLGRTYGYYIGMSANDLKLITGILIIGCILVSKTDIRRKFLTANNANGRKGGR
jgi:putative ABC transport system permease protein